MNLNTKLAGLRIYPGYFDRDAQTELLDDIHNVLAGGAFVHAAHAEIGPAVQRPHVELRITRLDFGRKRLPLSVDPSRNGTSLATDA